MNKFVLGVLLSVSATTSTAASVYCRGVVNDITVNSNGSVFLGLNTGFDGVVVPSNASKQAMKVALESMKQNKQILIRGFSDSSDTRCRDNNENIEFRSIRITQ